MIERAMSRAVTLVCLAAISCGPSSEQIRLQTERDELKKDVAELKQYNADLKFRMQLVEVRNRVLLDLVQGLTTDPDHFTPQRDKLAIADSSLHALDRDMEALVSSVRRSRDDVDALRTQRNSLENQLSQARRTIEEARATHAAVDARIDAVRAILAPIMDLVHAGRINVSVAYGQLAMQIPELALFARGAAELSVDGSALLDRIVQGLRTAPDRQYRIVGPSEAASKGGGAQRKLSEARSFAVLAHLTAAGIAPESLVAATHSVSVVQGREAEPATTRFFEIALLPKAEELQILPTSAQLLGAIQPSTEPAKPEINGEPGTAQPLSAPAQAAPAAP
jgi:flagellar motor protein MotB